LIASTSVVPALWSLEPADLFAVWLHADLLSPTVAVGQDEQPFPPMRLANFCRREKSSRNSEPHSLKLVPNNVEPE
jgi:hypothetical protein